MFWQARVARPRVGEPRYEFLPLSPDVPGKAEAAEAVQSRGLTVYLVEAAPGGFVVWRTREEHDDFYCLK